MTKKSSASNTGSRGRTGKKRAWTTCSTFAAFITSGFTLIELMVVIAIIGLLLGLSLIGLQGSRESARDAKRKSDIELVRSGLELYKTDCKKYPVATNNSQDIFSKSNLVGDPALGLTSCSNNVYISQIPKDPSDRLYVYRSNGVTYEICASLEAGGDPVTCGSPPSSNCGGSNICNYKATQP